MAVSRRNLIRIDDRGTADEQRAERRITVMQKTTSRSNRIMVARPLLAVGYGCLFIVVFTHIAERWHIFPSMGWGLRDSPGHYLDLFSAIAGVVLVLAGYVARHPPYPSRAPKDRA